MVHLNVDVPIEPVGKVIAEVGEEGVDITTPDALLPTIVHKPVSPLFKGAFPDKLYVPGQPIILAPVLAVVILLTVITTS
jgi:hypothetical protein